MKPKPAKINVNIETNLDEFKSLLEEFEIKALELSDLKDKINNFQIEMKATQLKGEAE